MTAVVILLVLLGAPDFEVLGNEYKEALSTSNWVKVRRVIKQLDKLNDARVLPWMLKEFEFANDEPLRRALFRALAFKRGSHRKGFLMEHLGSGDPYFRSLAVEGLAEVDIGRAMKRAVELLEVDDDSRVRRSAALVLLQAKTPEALRELIRATGKLPPHEQGPLMRLLHTVDPGWLAKVADMAGPGIPEEQLITVMMMARHSDARFQPALEAAAKAKHRSVALVAAVGLARLRGDEKAVALGRLLNVKSSRDKWDLYDLIARAGLREKVFLDALTKAVRSGTKSLRAKACEALGTVGRDKAVPVLVPLLRQKTPWQLPIGAARGLALSRAREAIEPLIEALAKTKGRLQNEIANALESLTGESFGRTPATWRKWWFERGVSFKVPEVAPTFWPEQGETQYAFYGIRLVSDRAAFVCDVSGSMKGTSIQTLQRELAAVVKRFPPQGKFNFIFFNDKVHPWAKKLVSANAKEKKKALAMIEKMGASGATNLWDALKRAMNDKDVDTIVLLSDGAPTAGKIQNSKKIAQTFFKLNRDRMVLLHVVAIGQVAPYLESMAKLSGGSYVER